MFVNKTVYFYENGNFYEAGSQHAGSLNIRTNTEKSLAPYRTVITKHTYNLASGIKPSKNRKNILSGNLYERRNLLNFIYK